MQGRGPYEDEVIETSSVRRPEGQRYSSNGRPRNPETRRREREHVRAANEVMQVTGIVEDSIAAKIKVKDDLELKTQETLTGLRLMEGGRAALVAGVWGVLGLRRRILLYRPYSQKTFVDVLRQEKHDFSLGHMVFAGMPTVFAYHFSDWAAFFLETVVEAVLDEDEGLTITQARLKNVLQNLIEIGCIYVTLHFRLFATMQQLNLIPTTKLLPSARSFIPFSHSSPLARPPPVSFNYGSFLAFGTALVKTATPFLILFVHGKVKYIISRIVYRPIYKSLPRPTGDSMFSGLAISPPTVEYDAPDQESGTNRRGQYRSEDESTLRALEGLPALERAETVNRAADGGREGSDDEDNEVTQATIISFDVESTENVEPALGTWSAELRSANELKPVEEVSYRVTGITMLPTIMATEGLREIAAGILALPLEAVMVRMIGKAYRQAGGFSTQDLWDIQPALRSLNFSNIIPAFGVQVIITGFVWGGFTTITHIWATRQRALAAQRAKIREAESRRLWEQS